MRRSLLLSACGFAVQGAVAVAQAPVATGLDSLSDEKLMADLSARGQNALLERAFQANNVPPAQRDALKSLGALRQLNDPNAKMTPGQRQQAARQIAAGIDIALPSVADPAAAMKHAKALVDAAVERDV